MADPRPSPEPSGARVPNPADASVRNADVDAAVAVRIDLPSRRGAASIRGVTADARTDAELLTDVAGGDKVAFEELHRRYARSVLGIALRRIGDRGRAEDATQDTFASIWRSASRFDPARGEATSWLYTVARNAIVDGLRRRREPPVDDAPELAAPGPEPDEVAEQGWVAWRVHRALEVLPEQERSLVELAYWGGLSQSEIADYLSIPLGTVKTRTRSALRRLADELEDELR
jgi:RNA polymerase sigma-70 factor (ECF subfamily)